MEMRITIDTFTISRDVSCKVEEKIVKKVVEERFVGREEVEVNRTLSKRGSDHDEAMIPEATKLEATMLEGTILEMTLLE